MSTNNFLNNNRCVVVSDDDFSNGDCDILKLGKTQFDEYNRNFPSMCVGSAYNKEIDKLIDSLEYGEIVVRGGYYQDTCLDYVFGDFDAMEELLGYSCYSLTEARINLRDYFTQRETVSIADKRERIEKICEILFQGKLDEEEKTMNRIIDMIRDEYGLIEIHKVGGFSNGEAVYEQIR